MSLQKASWAIFFTATSLLIPHFAIPALAFQQTMTCNAEGIYRCKAGETPKPVQWFTLDLTYDINSAGSKAIPNRPDGTIGAELEETIHKSFQTWTKPDCSELSFQYNGLTDQTNIGYYDGPDASRKVNMVIWRDETWPYGSFSAVALTTVTFSTNTGQIVDADIEMNGATFPFSNTDNPQGTDVDIQNTLTHEVGHFIGLDHSFDPNSTMYPTAPPLELSKRVLHDDDIKGLCHIYPLGFKNEPLTPKPKAKSGLCSITTITNNTHTPTPKKTLAVFTTLAGLALWTRRNSRKPHYTRKNSDP